MINACFAVEALFDFWGSHMRKRFTSLALAAIASFGLALSPIPAAAQMREIGGRCGVVLTGGMSRDIAYASAFIAGFKRGVARVEPDLVHRGLLAGALACEFGRPAPRAKQR